MLAYTLEKFTEEQDLECSTWESFAIVAGVGLSSLSFQWRGKKMGRSSTFRCDIPDLRSSEEPWAFQDVLLQF